MPILELAVAVAGFAVVAGYASWAWLTRGRDPTYADDPSILVPAPPPGMTAATATIIDGGPARLAFLAALLDLASRDEIAFEAEGREGDRTPVGIAIHGGESSDPAVRLNRRQPIGEGETWLLAQLRASLLAADRRQGGAGSDTSLPSPEAMQVASRMMAAMMQAATSTGTEDDDSAARAAREHGLSHGAALDPQAMARAYEARTGKPMPEQSLERLQQMAMAMEVFSDPAAIARDPDAAVRLIETKTGRPMPPEQLEELERWAATYAPPPVQPSDPTDPTQATPAVAATAAAQPEYISARQAMHLRAPLLFGTFLQSYAARHGWLAGLPFLQRLRWRLTALVEIAAGIVFAGLGATFAADPLTGLGLGVGVGGLVTWLFAPAMAARTPAGAEMKAQLAAYRRTLGMTFAQARSMDAAVAASGLRWLETPDQALVWGIALGLRAEIEALLSRTADDLRQGGQPAAVYAPAWYSSPAAGPISPASGGGAAADLGVPDPRVPDPRVPDPRVPDPGVPASLRDAASMFAGIEAIGSRGNGTT